MNIRIIGNDVELDLAFEVLRSLRSHPRIKTIDVDDRYHLTNSSDQAMIVDVEFDEKLITCLSELKGLTVYHD